MAVTISLSGDGIEFERDVSEQTALDIMELSMTDGETDESDGDCDAVEPDHLPSNFFNRLSSKQEALVKVLLDADGQITSTELRERMHDEHGVETGGGRALAGILAGLTRKYGDEFDLVDVNWGDGEGLYRLNPDRDGYLDELEAQFSG